MWSIRLLACRYCFGTALQAPYCQEHSAMIENCYLHLIHSKSRIGNAITQENLLFLILHRKKCVKRIPMLEGISPFVRKGMLVSRIIVVIRQLSEIMASPWLSEYAWLIWLQEAYSKGRSAIILMLVLNKSSRQPVYRYDRLSWIGRFNLSELALSCFRQSDDLIWLTSLLPPLEWVF